MTELLFTACLLVLAVVNGQQQFRFVDSTIEGFMKDENLPGCALVVNNGANRIYAKGYGVGDKSTRAKIDPDVSLFRVGSVSKTFTAAAVLMLVEENKLNLNSKVFGPSGLLNQYTLPAGSDGRLPQINLQMLLQHTGGWDRGKSGDPLDNTKGLYTRIAQQMGTTTPFNNDVLINWVLRQRLDFNPGSKFAYSNVGYMLLGEIVTKYSGTTYEKYVQQKVATLGINDMKLGKTRLAERAKNEVKYYFNPENQKVRSIFPQDGMVSPSYSSFPLENAAGAGAWLANMGDLVKFIHALDGTSWKTLFKMPETFAKMKARPSYQKSDAKTWYGMGLSMERQGVKYGHNGLVPGSISVMMHDFTGYNFAMTCNGLPGDLDTDSVIRYALSLEKGLTPNYLTVRHSGFDSVSSNGKYAVKAMIRDSELVTTVNSLRREGFELVRIESVEVGGTGLPGFSNPLQPAMESMAMPSQSMPKGVFFTTIWKKGNSRWNLEHGLTYQAVIMKIRNLQYSRSTMVRYLTAYNDNRGQVRHTLVTGPASGRWQALIGVPFNQQGYQVNMLARQGLKMITQDVHHVQGQAYVSSLFTSSAHFVNLVQAALPPQRYFELVQQGKTPVHLQVTPDVRTGQPLFNVLFTSGVKSEIHSQMSLYKLRMTLMDEALDGYMPLTIAGFEMMGHVVFEGIWIKELN